MSERKVTVDLFDKRGFFLFVISVNFVFCSQGVGVSWKGWEGITIVVGRDILNSIRVLAERFVFEW